MPEFLFALEAGIGGFSLSVGVKKMADYISQVDSIRDAIYQSATKVTPEVIAQANDLISTLNPERTGIIGTGTIPVGIGIYLLSAAYFGFKRTEINELKN